MNAAIITLIGVLITASAGVIGNAWVAYHNGVKQEKLERLRLQQQLLLDAVDTDVEQAKQNLKFLIDTGLLNETSGVDTNKIAAALEAGRSISTSDPRAVPKKRTSWIDPHILSLSEIPQLKIDPARISVSGFSSGAFMAAQFHVAHSAHISGVGVIAGGPYRCSESLSSKGKTALYTATNVCSSTNPYGFFDGPPDVEFSREATNEAAQLGEIDDPANLRNDRVWLLSGGRDQLVPSSVMEVVAEYYEAFVTQTNILFEQIPDASHAMITEDYGLSCDASGLPHLNDCDFDAAERIFTHILDPRSGSLADRAEAGRAPIVAFYQSEYFDRSDPSVSMYDVGHLYIPAACSQGATCSLHVAFHGCNQDQEMIGPAFFMHAGYNQWAESNNIVVLYPQATAWGSFERTKNPQGCWDWWGYSGKDYYRKSGKQVRAVAAMINELLDEETLETPLRK